MSLFALDVNREIQAESLNQDLNIVFRLSNENLVDFNAFRMLEERRLQKVGKTTARRKWDIQYSSRE